MEQQGYTLDHLLLQEFLVKTQYSQLLHLLVEAEEKIQTLVLLSQADQVAVVQDQVQALEGLETHLQ